MLDDASLFVALPAERPRYRVLTAGEAYETLTAFERDHPSEARAAVWLMGWEYDGAEAARRQLAYNIRLVAFRPH